MKQRRSFGRAGIIAAAAALIAALPALAQAPSSQASLPAALPSAAPKCAVSPDLARFEVALPRVALRLSGGLPIKIVAIGSSSTAGTGATSPANTYPSRLEVELNRHFPGHDLTVINRGVGGEETRDMLARFDEAVIAENPHLVIWQVGTNALLRDRPLDLRASALHEGIDRLKAIRADIVLMDPQFAPRVIAKPDRDAVVEQIATVAKEEKVGLFRRYETMRRWQEVDGLSFDSFVSPDGLHMNDWSYACLAKSLGVAIAEAANRPTETAAAPIPKR
jgi:acyl-CoA thioesterase-1